MTQSATSSDTRPLTAFISGPLEVSPEYFNKYYEPQIDTAIARGDHFVVGPVSGIDCLAYDYLRSRVSPSRVRVHMASFEIAARPAFVKQVRAVLGDAGIVEATKAGGSEATTTWDRDASMTRASDYDILRFRTEWECKAVYGDSWIPRVSNTERNARRRKGDAGCEEFGIEYVKHVSEREVSMRAAKLLKASDKTTGTKECDGRCDAHRDVKYLPLIMGRKAFGYGFAGMRNV